MTLGLDLAVIALIGGGLSLDRRGAFQFMISQPLVAVPLLGLCLGLPVEGMKLRPWSSCCGWPRPSSGANVPHNETVAGRPSGHVLPGRAPRRAHRARGAGGRVHPARGAAVPAGALGRDRSDRANMLLARRADTTVRGEHPEHIARLPALGLVRAFLLGAGLVTGGLRRLRPPAGPAHASPPSRSGPRSRPC
ncbi:MAG: hypothetical protein R3F43_04075 [bacterium]